MEENKVIQMQDKEDTKVNNTSEQQVSEESKISVLDFIKKYNSMTSDKAKKTYLQRVVKGDDYYIPYTEKVVYARDILEIANFDKEGKVLFNGAKQYLLYICTVLTLYTMLDISHKDFSVAFDLLNQQNLIDVLLENMPDDKTEFDVIFQLAQGDFEKNYGEIKFNVNDITNMINKSMTDSIQIVLDIINNIVNTNINSTNVDGTHTDSASQKVQEV